MPVTIVADSGTEFHAQQIPVKTNRGHHIVGDESEVIDALQVHDI